MRIRMDVHVHSIASGHAFNTVYEIMNLAGKRNMELVCIVDHGPSMKGAPHAEYFEMAGEVPLKFGRCLCLMGCECNIVDCQGSLDLTERFLRSLDLVLAGLHKLTPYPPSSTEKCNTQAIINAMRNPYVDIIAHPYRKDFPVDIGSVVKAAAQYNCLLELNCRVLSNISKKDIIFREYNRMLELCVQHGVYMVTGTDAHIASRVGDFSSLRDLGILDNFKDNIISNLDEFFKRLLRRRTRKKFSEENLQHGRVI